MSYIKVGDIMEKWYEVKISSKGSIQIPQEILKKHGMTTGAMMCFEVVDNDTFLMKQVK